MESSDIPSYIYACSQLGLALQLARCFSPCGVGLSEVCQLRGELTVLMGIFLQNWFLDLVDLENEPYVYQKKINHKMKVKASPKSNLHFCLQKNIVTFQFCVL